MYKIIFYERANGKMPVRDFIESFRNDNKAKEKIFTYIEHLKAYGFDLDSQYIKKIVNTNLWELRPKNNRIFFFYHKDNAFILLHAFEKKSQKTPVKEIDTALRYMYDYLNRGEDNDEL